MLTVLKTNDRALAERLRKMDDIVDELYTAIKLYLTQISREALDEKEGRRWTDIVSFTINMEQVGDIIERVITDLEEKKIEKGRKLLRRRHAGDLRPARAAARQPAPGMSVFLHGDLKSAQRCSRRRCCSATSSAPTPNRISSGSPATPCRASRRRRCTST